MAQAPQSNDSILSVGLDVAEQTEQSVGEIAASLDGNDQAAPQVEAEAQSVEDPELQEARELAAVAREQEAADRAQELAHDQELEHDELER